MLKKVKEKFSFWRNRTIAFSYDCCMIAVAWLSAYWFRFDLGVIPILYFKQALTTLPVVVLLQAAIFWAYGLYRGVWRFASIPDLTRIIKSTGVGIVGILILAFGLKTDMELPRAIPLLYGILLVMGLGGGRAAFRWLKDYRKVFYDHKRVLVVGAGNAGEGVIRDLIRQDKQVYLPVAIVDDNPIKLHRDIHGVSVVGTCGQIPLLVEQYKIDLIIIAVPSAKAAEMRRIVSVCDEAAVPYQTLPGVRDLTEGKVDVKKLREVALEDLLGRDPINLSWSSLSSEFQGKAILICGGGGSIGSELCHQVAQFNPSSIILVDHHEYNLYACDMELRKRFPYLNLVSFLQSATDRVGLKKIFETYKPHVVFHAAAYKHVPLLEYQQRAAIFNNIIGTRIIAEVSAEYGAHKFVLISTDKAVNPTNIMGATKRAAEIFCQSYNATTQTEFITVRFGNVLDSAGSVIPLFRKQLQSGGPLTVTHPEITRFFMTIPEASQLIIQAAAMGKGGEIFVLDMGESVKIRYLAEQMIRLAGKIPGDDIEILYTGLRPGEKLYEELFYEQEQLRSTDHPKVLLADAQKVNWDEWLSILNDIQAACDSSSAIMLQELLQRLVPEYKNK